MIYINAVYTLKQTSLISTDRQTVYRQREERSHRLFSLGRICWNPPPRLRRRRFLLRRRYLSRGSSCGPLGTHAA